MTIKQRLAQWVMSVAEPDRLIHRNSINRQQKRIDELTQRVVELEEAQRDRFYNEMQAILGELGLALGDRLGPGEWEVRDKWNGVVFTGSIAEIKEWAAEDEVETLTLAGVNFP